METGSGLPDPDLYQGLMAWALARIYHETQAVFLIVCFPVRDFDISLRVQSMPVEDIPWLYDNKFVSS